jgi:hydroxyacylglutathione hydrolase
MLGKLFCPGLLETGPVDQGLWAILDGFVNYYVVEAPAGLICIDTGWRNSRLRSGFKRIGFDTRDVVAVFLTHLHWDHASCAGMFPGAELFAGGGEVPSGFMKRRLSNLSLTQVADGQSVIVAGTTVLGIKTPGHTHGSMSYLVEGRKLFTGDTIRLSNGRVVPFPACFNRDGEALERSIRVLARIQGTENLLTSHSGLCRDPESAFDRWQTPRSGNNP